MATRTVVIESTSDRVVIPGPTEFSIVTVGVQGPRGLQGEQGEQGDQGLPGASLTDHADLSDLTASGHPSTVISASEPDHWLGDDFSNVQGLIDQLEEYVDEKIIGNIFLYATDVRAVSTTNITLSGSQAFDGVTPTNGQLVLVAGQTLGQNNGVYVVNTSGAWTRWSGLDEDSEAEVGTTVHIHNPDSDHAAKYYILASLNVVVGTTDQVWIDIQLLAPTLVQLIVQAGQNFHTGDGSPEGVTSADTGALYLDTTGGDLYVKGSGTGNTGWLLVATETDVEYDTSEAFVFPDTSSLTVQEAFENVDARLSDGLSSPLLSYGQEFIPWRTAVGARASSPVNIWCVGDSHTEGFYAVTLADRYTQKLADRIAGAFGHTNGVGYLPAGGTGGYINQWTTVAGSVVTQNNANGIGKWKTFLNSGSAISTTQTCDRFFIVFPKYPLLPGSFTVQIDGGSESAAQSVSAATVRSGYIWDSGALTPGSHTVRINGKTLGAQIEGAFFFNGDYSGARVIQCAHQGYTTAQMVSTSTNGSSMFDAMDTGSFPPHIVFLEAGGNDIFFSVSESTFRTNLAAIVDLIRDKATGVNPTIVITMSFTSNNPTWQTFRRVMYQVAIEKGCAILDWYNILGDITGTTWSHDDLHANALGQRTIGEMTARWLLSGTPALLAGSIDGGSA